jgi:hypothetical protein
MGGCWSRSLIRLLAVAAVVAILGSGQAARAQDDEEEEPAPNAALLPGVVVFNEAQFDQWLFGQLGTTNAGAARSKVETFLTLSVDDLARTCNLTPLQKKKFLLAGHGDIKRYFDRVDETRKKFKSSKNDPNQFGLMWQDIQVLQTAFHEIFGEGSIFGKSLKSTLNPEQAAGHEKVVRDRLLYRYQARVDLAMEMLNNNVGFTDEQRERLVKLLLEGTRPPRRLGQNDYYAVLYLLGTLPEAKVKSLFDEAQYRSLKQQLDQARGLGMWLKQNGFVPAEGDVAPQAAVRPMPGAVIIRAMPLLPAAPKAAVTKPAAPRAAAPDRKN